MQVKLVEELFGTAVYDLEVTQDSLAFSNPDGSSIIIPFSELRHFSAEGKGHRLNWFVLESASKIYEGRFLNETDADRLIALLREKCGCYTDIRLDME